MEILYLEGGEAPAQAAQSSVSTPSLEVFKASWDWDWVALKGPYDPGCFMLCKGLGAALGLQSQGGSCKMCSTITKLVAAPAL